MFLIWLGVPRAVRFNIWSPNVAEFSNPDFTRTELRRTKTNSDFNQDFCRVGKWRWSKNLDVFVSVRVKDRPQFCVRRLERGADANGAGSTIHYGIAGRWTLALKIVFSRSWDTGLLYLSPPAPPRHQAKPLMVPVPGTRPRPVRLLQTSTLEYSRHELCMTD